MDKLGAMLMVIDGMKSIKKGSINAPSVYYQSSASLFLA